jgi:hypothetical protein
MALDLAILGFLISLRAGLYQRFENLNLDAQISIF